MLPAGVAAAGRWSLNRESECRGGPKCTQVPYYATLLYSLECSYHSSTVLYLEA